MIMGEENFYWGEVLNKRVLWSNLGCPKSKPDLNPTNPKARVQGGLTSGEHFHGPSDGPDLIQGGSKKIRSLFNAGDCLILKDPNNPKP